MSGDLSATPGIRIEGSAGAVEIGEGVICARRHLHASPEEALMLGLRDKDEVSIRVTGERPIVFGDVAVRVHPEYRLDVHVDTDEANAARLDRGAVGYIENVDVRS
jgi:acetate kinase